MAKAWVLPDAIDTDVILPGRYLSLTSEAELAKHALEGWDPKLAISIGKGDIIVAGRNFGCGSSREQAPVALKGLGIKCIIAESFARIFYRNAINIGLIVLEIMVGKLDCKVEAGDEVELVNNWSELSNLSKGNSIKLITPPDFITSIIKNGGIVAHLKKAGST